MPDGDSEISRAMLKRDVDELKTAVEALRTDIAGLLEAWRTAGGLLVFIKWSGIAGAALAAWFTIKDHLP